MSTGIETWNMNLLDIGPMYPFPHTEVIWFLIGLATWIIWHIVQGRMESKIYEEDEQLFGTKEKLAKAMQISNAETLNEALKMHRESLK